MDRDEFIKEILSEMKKANEPIYTLRDYFAAAAMAVLRSTDGYETTAEWCFRMADAMLKERDNGQENFKCCGSCKHAHLVNTGLGCFNPTLTATGEPDDYNVVILEGDCDKCEAR